MEMQGAGDPSTWGQDATSAGELDSGSHSDPMASQGLTLTNEDLYAAKKLEPGAPESDNTEQTQQQTQKEWDYKKQLADTDRSHQEFRKQVAEKEAESAQLIGELTKHIAALQDNMPKPPPEPDPRSKFIEDIRNMPLPDEDFDASDVKECFKTYQDKLAEIVSMPAQNTGDDAVQQQMHTILSSLQTIQAKVEAQERKDMVGNVLNSLDQKFSKGEPIYRANAVQSVQEFFEGMSPSEITNPMMFKALEIAYEKQALKESPQQTQTPKVASIPPDAGGGLPPGKKPLGRATHKQLFDKTRSASENLEELLQP